MFAALKPDVVLSTKVRVPAERPDVGAAIAASLDASLKRLKRDHVDVFQLHNTIAARADGMTMSVDEVLGDVVPALNRAREQGKTRFIGFTAIGETDALLALIASGAFDSAQVPYNALNPSAGEAIAAAYPAQDYDRILDRAAEKGVGTIGIRALAGGALSGRTERNPLGLRRGRADRLGRGLCEGRGARQAAGADGARGPCVEPDRDGDALRRSPIRSSRPPRSGLRTSTSWKRR